MSATETLSKLAKPVAALMLVALLASTGFQVYAFWIKPPEQSAAAPVSQPTTQQNNTRQRVPMNQIAAIPLFGDAAAVAIEPDIPDEPLPKTNLRLVLQGVSASQQARYSTALIEDDRREVKVYAVGDTLPGNAVLKAVHNNRVVLDRSGRFEELFFPELSSDGIETELASDDSSFDEPEEQFTEEGFAEESFAGEDIQQEIQQADASFDDSAPDSPAYTFDQLSQERKDQIRDRLLQLRKNLQEKNRLAP